MPSPRVSAQVVLGRAYVRSPQYEAIGHTNLFFNLFYFSSEHHLRQTAQENKPYFGSSQPSSISKCSWVLPKCDLFSWAAVCTDALNWNKIDWKTNWSALAPPAVSYHASKLVSPPTLYWNPTDPNHKVETAQLRWEGPTQTQNSHLILGLQFNTALTCHSAASSQLHSLARVTSSDDMSNTVTAYSLKQNLTSILSYDSSSKSGFSPACGFSCSFCSNLFKRPGPFQVFHTKVQDAMCFFGFWDRDLWCLLFRDLPCSCFWVQTKGVCHQASLKGCNFIEMILKGNPQSTANTPCRHHKVFPQKPLRKCGYWHWKCSSGTEHLLAVEQAWVPFPTPPKMQVSLTEEHKQLQA